MNIPLVEREVQRQREAAVRIDAQGNVVTDASKLKDAEAGGQQG